jgi:hypothetical protein
MAGLGIAFILLLLIPLWLLVWALIDLLRRPRIQWQKADQNQIIWALVIIFIGIIGPILYLTIARPKLRDVAGYNPTVAT